MSGGKNKKKRQVEPSAVAGTTPEQALSPNERRNKFIVSGVLVAVVAVAWTVLVTVPNPLRAAFGWGEESSEPVLEQVGPTGTYRMLDGVAVDDPSLATPFPISVMYDNSPNARPHAGLSSAAVVYETLVEGGATRLLAIFGQSDEEKIGPIRSARPYYLEWVSEYDALYVHAGGSPEALAAIDAFDIHDLNHQGKYFFRDTTQFAPHNLYATSELLTFALRDLELLDVVPTFEPWRFKDEAALGSRGVDGQEIAVHFSSGGTYLASYRYEQATNRYLRFNANEADLDATTGEQLSATNVVVIMIPEIADIGEKGRLTLDIHGEGVAYVFRDGQKVKGTWKKADRTSRTRFYDAAGSEIELNRGNTWIAAVPGDREVTHVEPGG